MAAMAFGAAVKAQNLQVHYDFGKDRKQITTTLEMFKPDKYGSTSMKNESLNTNPDRPNSRELGYGHFQPTAAPTHSRTTGCNANSGG